MNRPRRAARVHAGRYVAPRRCHGRLRTPALGGSLTAAGLLIVLTSCAPQAAPAPGTAPASPAPAYSPLSLGPAERGAARRTAHAALRAYARPRLPARAWWAGLRPYLSADAQLAYAGTDPRAITVTGVTGAARLTPASSPVLARVAIPTRNGSYLLLLTRTVHRRDWLVARIVAPELVE